MMQQPLILREGAPSKLVRLEAPIADALAALEILQLARTGESGVWEVQAGTRIGAVVAGGLQVVIQPKVDINRLVFLMAYARNPRFWRDDIVRLDDHSALPEALADAFLAHAHKAVEQGLHKGYITVDETLTVLRGRFREGDQLRRHFGRTLPLEVRYDEYSVDIAENQLLLAAVERLLRLPGIQLHHRAGLQRLRLQLSDVTSLHRGARPPRWTPSRLNVRYQPALRLADLILAGRSFEQRIGDVAVTGYLFNMATIFEDFVTVALREAFLPYGGRSILQYRDYLDEDERVLIQPDFVWLRDDEPRVVVDAKYKAERPSGFPQADLYQMLAYCTALRLDEGHLIYAKGNELATKHSIRNSRVRVMAHTIDLTSSPAAILDSVGRLAEVMYSTRKLSERAANYLNLAVASPDRIPPVRRASFARKPPTISLNTSGR